MGWKDAPIVSGGAGTPAWQNAPVVGTALERLPPDLSQPQPKPVSQENRDDIAHRILGLGETGLSAATGAAGALAGQVYGIGKTLTSGKFGTQAGIKAGEKAGTELAEKLTYQPRTQTGKNISEALGKSEALRALQGLPVEGPMIARLPEVPGAVLRTAEGVADINRGVARTAAAPAKAMTRKAINALPDLDPATKDLAREAHGMGFRLTPDQVYGNKYGKFAGELAGENPFIKTAREHNNALFNQKLVDLVGGEGPKLTRKTFANAMNKSGKTIENITSSKEIPFDAPFVDKLAGHVEEADKFQTPEVANVVRSYVNDIESKTQNGVLPGKAFRTLNTKLSNQIRSTQNGDLRNSLRDLQEDLLDQFIPTLNAKETATYNAARRQYAVGKTLEPLLAKAPTGEVNPGLLLGAVTRTAAGKSAASRGAAGDLGKLADIGQKFLKPLPSSGTAERSLMQNLLTHPFGTLAAGGTAAATAPAAAAYNRYGPEVTQQLINRPPTP